MMHTTDQFRDQTAGRLKTMALEELRRSPQACRDVPGEAAAGRAGPLKGEEAQYAAAWLGELRRRLERLEDQMPEDFSSVNFEYWMERFIDLSEQIRLLEQLIHG